ncbi:hypothetical protein GWK26_08555 [haloarchaeon 3A1-DGR]|nr:hypothetical protein GWK26_08555 [haloarchaeon 3A1-DGR]
MSVRDIPKAFKEDTHVLLLFPAVAHGYLFHITGNTWYMIFATLALVSPSMEFFIFYINDVDDLTQYGHRLVIEKVSVTAGLLYVLQAILHILSTIGLIWHIDHTDYIHIFLLLSSILLAFIVLWGILFSDFSTFIHNARDMSVNKRIDEDWSKDE